MSEPVLPADPVRDHEGSVCWCLTSEQPFYECVRAAQDAESVGLVIPSTPVKASDLVLSLEAAAERRETLVYRQAMEIRRLRRELDDLRDGQHPTHVLTARIDGVAKGRGDCLA